MHMNVSSGVKLGQVKNLMNFCKTSKRENRKVRKVAKSSRKPRITKAVLLQAFFPPAKTLKCRRVSNYSPIPKLSRVFFFFFPEFLSKVPIQGTARPTPPSPSLVKSSLASSWFMRNCEGEVTWSTGLYTRSVFLAKQVWPKSLLAWLLFGWRRERRKKLSQQRGSDGDQCLAFLLLSR